MIAIPIVARTMGEALARIEAARTLADAIELRLDYLERPDPRTLVKACGLPVIATCRSVRDRGEFRGSEEERIGLLQRAADAGADFVDLELECAGKVRRGPKTRLIASAHDFERTPDDLIPIHRRLAATGADVVKVVTWANDIRDNLRLFELTRHADVPTIAFGMGERGVISRILTGKFGGFLTFGSIETGAESAPGQVTARELRDLYRYPTIGPRTKLYGVIARPVAHSLSPAILNAAFIDADLDACYVPMLTDDAPATVGAFRALEFSGYSVTLPHKEVVMGALDEVESIARDIGAVNTIVRRPDGALWGANTDCEAAIASIEVALPPNASSRSPLAGRKTALIGARGAARAIGFGLKRAGAVITVYNRTVEKARELAAELKCDYAGLDQIQNLQADVVANATSVGMHPDVDQTPVPASVLRPGMVVFDAVYRPLFTRLLREAQAAGCKVVTGLEMFVGQAAEQFRLWTGLRPPVDLMRRIVLEHLEKRTE